MLLQVKTYLAPDKHGGTGLFAGQDIPAGTVVTRYDPAFVKFFTTEAYFAMPDGPTKQHIERYGYPIYEPMQVPPLDGIMLDLDDSRYTNHSDDPNIGFSVSEPEIFRALRPIPIGAEITCDYRSFDPDFSFYKRGVKTCLDFLAPRPNKEAL